jgi:hypothetical protein
MLKIIVIVLCLLSSWSQGVSYRLNKSMDLLVYADSTGCHLPKIIDKCLFYIRQLDITQSLSAKQVTCLLTDLADMHLYSIDTVIVPSMSLKSLNKLLAGLANYTVRKLVLYEASVGQNNLDFYCPQGLEWLDLRGNELNDDFMYVLAPRLPYSLKGLFLQGNNFSDKGFVMLSYYLPDRLRALYINDTQMGYKGFLSLIKAIQNTHTTLYTRVDYLAQSSKIHTSLPVEPTLTNSFCYDGAIKIHGANVRNSHIKSLTN